MLSPDNPHTLTTRHNIADWTGETGNAAAALRLSQQLLHDLVRVLGSDHPGTLTTRAHIADWAETERLLSATGDDDDLGRSRTADEQLTLAIKQDFTILGVAVLVSGCRRFGTKQMIEATLSRTDRSNLPESGFLQLVDSGYDPWQVGLWWSFPTAALGAALAAIEEGDGENLRLILRLNRSNAHKHGAALKLLAGGREAPESPHADQRATLITSLG